MARANAVGQTKVMQCRGCGCDMTVNYYKRVQPQCADCGQEAVAEAIRQMRQKSGPIYDHYLAGIAAYANRNRRGTPSPD